VGGLSAEGGRRERTCGNKGQGRQGESGQRAMGARTTGRTPELYSAAGAHAVVVVYVCTTCTCMYMCGVPCCAVARGQLELRNA